ncbi:hypothetical protein BGZ63DRAFT_434054 [Mariannaea sp. PMI_226]|nr:hypothetical protein BGZ63DRAFT_434054 [Mariannaea sp. PMI_226]
MLPHFITVVSCLSIAAAMPANRLAMDERAVREVLDVLETRGDDVYSLIKRIDPKTGYSVDQGIKLPKKGKDDACTTGHGADHCWTEYYFVESAVEYSSWQNSGAAIDCNTTYTCNSDVAEQQQSCTAFTKSSSNGVDWQIVEAKFEYGIPNTQSKFSIGANVKYQHTDVTADTTQICTTDSTTNRCTWNDQGCHQVWFADRTKRIWGHVSRVCVGQTNVGTTVQQQTLNKDGRWVRGQAEFSIALPINRIVGCNALCEDLTYNEPLPNEGTGRVPFDVTFD